MNSYEMLYIIASNCDEKARDAVISKLEGAVTQSGGAVEKIDKWGNRKLAYPINYRNDGFYVLMSFSCAPSLVKELDRLAGINDNIIRRMITAKLK